VTCAWRVQGHVTCLFSFEAKEKGQLSINRGACFHASCARADPPSFLAPHAIGRACCARARAGHWPAACQRATDLLARGSERPQPLYAANQEVQRAVLTGLDLCAGETFEVMDDGLKHAGWRQVQSLDGTRSGYVPANYIEVEVRTSPSDLRRGPGSVRSSVSGIC
jgi:hypothetical protein